MMEPMSPRRGASPRLIAVSWDPDFPVTIAASLPPALLASDAAIRTPFGSASKLRHTAFALRDFPVWLLSWSRFSFAGQSTILPAFAFAHLGAPNVVIGAGPRDHDCGLVPSRPLRGGLYSSRSRGSSRSSCGIRSERAPYLVLAAAASSSRHPAPGSPFLLLAMLVGHRTGGAPSPPDGRGGRRHSHHPARAPSSSRGGGCMAGWARASAHHRVAPPAWCRSPGATGSAFLRAPFMAVSRARALTGAGDAPAGGAVRHRLARPAAEGAPRYPRRREPRLVPGRARSPRWGPCGRLLHRVRVAINKCWARPRLAGAARSSPPSDRGAWSRGPDARLGRADSSGAASRARPRQPGGGYGGGNAPWRRAEPVHRVARRGVRAAGRAFRRHQRSAQRAAGVRAQRAAERSPIISAMAWPHHGGAPGLKSADPRRFAVADAWASCGVRGGWRLRLAALVLDLARRPRPASSPETSTAAETPWDQRLARLVRLRSRELRPRPNHITTPLSLAWRGRGLLFARGEVRAARWGRAGHWLGLAACGCAGRRDGIRWRRTRALTWRRVLSTVGTARRWRTASTPSGPSPGSVASPDFRAGRWGRSLLRLCARRA